MLIPICEKSELALEVADGGASLLVAPGRVARVEDEPALATRDEPVLGRLDPRLRNHRRDPAIPVAALGRLWATRFNDVDAAGIRSSGDVGSPPDVPGDEEAVALLDHVFDDRDSVSR